MYEWIKLVIDRLDILTTGSYYYYDNALVLDWFLIVSCVCSGPVEASVSSRHKGPVYCVTVGDSDEEHRSPAQPAVSNSTFYLRVLTTDQLFFKNNFDYF